MYQFHIKKNKFHAYCLVLYTHRTHGSDKAQLQPGLPHRPFGAPLTAARGESPRGHVAGAGEEVFSGGCVPILLH